MMTAMIRSALAKQFREIEAEDIAQQILTLFLELVDSPSPITISNHLPIAPGCRERTLQTALCLVV